MGLVHSPRIVTDGLVAYYDLGNTRRSYSPNVHPGSTNIYDWYVGIRGNAGANNSTLVKDTITSPVGNTPLRMDITGNDPHIGSYYGLEWNLDEASQGETWTVSVYAKATSNINCQIFIFGTPSTGGYVEAPAGTINLTTDWKRISYTHTFTNANTAFIQSRLDGPDSGGAGESIWFDGWQVERGSTPSNFTSDYTSGDILDIFGSSNTGSIVSTPQYSNEYGGSLIFDGSNDYVNAPVTKTASCTFSCWAKTTTLSGNPMLFNAGRSGSGVGGPDLFFYNNMISWNTWDGSNNPFASTPTSVTDGNWHYYVVVNDASSNAKLYYDGELLGTATYRDASANTNLTIGGNINTYMWNGSISNFQLHNKVLTASEITQNFNALRGRYGV